MMKRIFDLAFSLAVVVLGAPVFVVVALAVRVFLGRPVVFRHVRTGLNGALFVVYKFRTMRDAVDRDGSPLPDADRLTRFGRFLRSTSLDELPQFVNVLRGEMSVVGPRPLLPEYLTLYTPEQNRRHDVRPGITGWAQVTGRNARPWEEKLAKDVWDVDHANVMLDLRILLLTVAKVLRRRGITGANHVTMERFRGTASGTVSDLGRGGPR